MATEAFSLVGRIALDGARRVRDSLNDISNEASNTGDKLNKTGGKFSKFSKKLGQFGKVAGGAAAAGFAVLGGVVGKAGLDFNAMEEQSKVAWKTLLGTSDAADKMIGKIQDFAAATPFAVENVDMMAKYLHNAGYEGQAMFDELMKISDVASAFSIPAAEAKEMARQMSQVQQAGVAYTEDLNVLQDRGVPIFQALSEVMGVQVKDVKKLASEGKVTADVYSEAFNRISGEVKGASEAQSKTFTGMISTLRDNFNKLAGEMTSGAFAFVKDILPIIIAGLEKMNTLFAEGGWSAVFRELLPPAVYEFLKSAIAGILAVYNMLFGEESQGKMNQFKSYLSKIGSTFTWIWEIVKFVWDMIAPYLLEKFAQIKMFWDQYGEPFKLAVLNAFKFIQAAITLAMPIIKMIIQSTFAGIKNIIDGILKIIMGIIKVFIGIFTGDFKTAWSGVVQIFKGAVQLIWGLITTFFLGKILGGFKTLGTKTGTIFKGIWTKGKKAFNDLKGLVGKVVDDIVGFFKGLGNKLKFKIPKPKLPHFSISGKLSLKPPSIPKVSVNWRAQGGFLNSAQLIGAGEVREAILPLENRKNMQPFAAAIAENLAAMKGGGLQSLEVPIILNTREILRAIIPDIDRELAKRANKQSGLVNRGNL
jgi:tape measure domain-containing protein